MALTLATDTIDLFKRTTNFDLEGYLTLYADFVDKNYRNYIDYYKGRTNDLKQESVDAFTSLINGRDELDGVLVYTANSFDRVDFWNLLDFLEEISAKVTYINKISKFLRSAKYDGFNEDSLTIDYQMADFDTPDIIAARERDNPQDQWTDIFSKNNVLETDYRAEQGGLNLSLGKKQLNNVFLNTVVDNLIGTNLYGKDIDKTFLFEDDDIKVLSPRDTFKQSVIILSKLAKGDVPEHPEMGITPSVQIGSNLGALNVPFMTRELRETFATDDTMLNVQIQDILIEGSTMFVEFEVESFYNLTEQSSFKI